MVPDVPARRPPVRVLLTGATGLLGSHAAPLLAGAGHEVLALSRTRRRRAVGCYDGWRATFRAPRRRSRRRRRGRRRPPRAVRAIPGVPRGRSGCVGRQRRRGRSAPGRRLSCWRLPCRPRLDRGRVAPSDDPLEDDPVDPHGLYAASKRAAELIAGAYSELLDVVVLRPFFVYGPGQRTGMLIRRLAERVLADEPVTVSGEQGIVMNPVHASDAARAVLASVEAPNGVGVVNVAGLEMPACRISCSCSRTRRIAKPGYCTISGPPPRLVADITKMRTRLEVDPRTRLADGLAGVIEALR